MFISLTFDVNYAVICKVNSLTDILKKHFRISEIQPREKYIHNWTLLEFCKPQALLLTGFPWGSIDLFSNFTAHFILRSYHAIRLWRMAAVPFFWSIEKSVQTLRRCFDWWGVKILWRILHINFLSTHTFPYDA